MEIFTNMEIALLSELNSDHVIDALSPEPWHNAIEQPGDTSFGAYSLASVRVFDTDNLTGLYSKLAQVLERSLQDDPPVDAAPEWPR